MKHSDFVCDCGGSGREVINIGSGNMRRFSVLCPCDHKTAIEKIDLKVPDDLTFNQRCHFIENELMKLPHKIGDKWVCEVCKGATTGDKYIQEIPCFECKGLKAECIDIQVEGKQLIVTWREV